MRLRSYSVDTVAAASHGATDYAADAAEYAGTAAAASGTVAIAGVVPRGEGDSGKKDGGKINVELLCIRLQCVLSPRSLSLVFATHQVVGGTHKNAQKREFSK